MTDVTLDALLEAVRFLVGCQRPVDDFEKKAIIHQMDKLDALIAQRRGRPDDQLPGA